MLLQTLCKNEMNYEDKKFRIGVTFSGKYRENYIEPLCRSLLKLGYTKDEIFYDFWHEAWINGPHGDSKLRKVYNQNCDCVVVLLSPDYREKNWTGHIEWPAVKEMINTGLDEKICLLGIDKVEIDKIDGLYSNQAIVKFIDKMTPDEVADFVNRKYIQIIQKARTKTSTQYTQLILEETRRFVKELESLNVVVADGHKINIINQLKTTSREGKRVRLNDLKNTNIKPRSIFDHIISLAYLADAIGPIIGEERWDASETARLIAYHEIAEAIIGDIASYTVSEPLIRGPERFETANRELIVNKFISLYADKKQQESIGYLNNRIKPTGKRKNELSEQMAYFKALDHLDCLIAIWRYLFYYRSQCTPEQLSEFIDVMSDFFANKRLKEEDVLSKTPIFQRIISFISNKANAKKYVAGHSIEKLFKEEDNVVGAVIYLIEEVPLFC